MTVSTLGLFALSAIDAGQGLLVLAVIYLNQTLS